MMKDYTNKQKENLRVFITLRRAHQSIARQNLRFMSRYHLTETQFAVLEMLYHKGELCVQDVVDTLLSTSGNVTVVIQNLVKEGYIHRLSDQQDRRRYLLSLTPKGHHLIDQIFPEYLTFLEKRMSVLSSHEQIELAALLKKLGTYNQGE